MIVRDYQNYERETYVMSLEITREELQADPTVFHDVLKFLQQRKALIRCIDEHFTQGTSNIKNPTGLLAGTTDPDYTFEEP